MKINQKAWVILSEVEKTILHLSYIEKKSSWEIGAILNKAHYKTLELKNRADRLLKMFQEYFTIHDSLLPTEFYMDPIVAEYFDLVIAQRKTVREAYNQIDDPEFKRSFNRDRTIDRAIRALKKADTDETRDFLDILVEFDRWNNFRVLPYHWQEPSAFKRRNRSRELKFLKRMVSIHPLTISKIVSEYNYKGTEHKLYVALIQPEYEKCLVMGLRGIPNIIKTLSDLGLYIFRDKEVCQSFCENVHIYFYRSHSPSTKGVRFWKDYAKFMGETINYREVQHILSFRRFREDASEVDDI